METNISKGYEIFLRRLKIEKLIIWAVRIGVLLALVGLWELLVRIDFLDGFIFSSPTRIYRQISILFSEHQLFHHIWVTLYVCILGFLIATFLGTLIAIILWYFPRVNKVLEPYIITLNALPKVALGPVIIIWVGTGTKAVITMAVLIAIVISIITMLNAFLETSPEKIMLMKTFGANRLQILQKLVLPASYPAFLSLLKINVGLAWVGTIMGEYLSSRAGLGYLILLGQQLFRMDLVMASIIILCILATLMYASIALLERLVARKS
ncbi:MAG: ABC transporter permease [Firmicutes bacterium]|nr:ABC transporter permease [Bacillota bacterium]